MDEHARIVKRLGHRQASVLKLKVTAGPLLEHYFVYACIWAFGGAMVIDKGKNQRAKFSQLWKENFKYIQFPKRGTVFDYFFSPEAAARHRRVRGAIHPWR